MLRRPAIRTGWSPDETVVKSRLAMTVAAATLLTALAAWNSAHKSLWTDEVYSLITTTGSLSHTFHRAAEYELQPPLYFLILNLWRRLSPAPQFARALSTLCAVGCVVGLGAITRQLRLARGPSAPLLAAVTPGVVWAASEVRVYALMLALATGTLYFFLRLTVGETRHPRRDAACYAVLAYALIMTGYYGGFLVAGQWLAAVAVRRWKAVTAALAVVAMGLLPWIPRIAAQAHAHPKPIAPFTGVADAAFGLSQLFLQAYLGATPLLTWPHVTALLIAVGLGLVILRLLGGAMGLEERALVICAVVPMAIIAALRITATVSILPRYALLIGPTLLALASLWASRPQSAVVRRVTAGVVGAVLCAGLVAFEWHGAEVTDWRGVTALLARERSDTTQPVLVTPAQDALGLQYYYPGPGIVGGMPADFDLARYRPEAYDIHDTAQVLARFDTTGARTGVWIVASRWEARSPEQIDLVTRAVAARYCPPSVTSLRGIHVLHAVSRPCPPTVR